MEDDNKYRIEILDGSNYAIWKWQMLSILKAKGLNGVINAAKLESADLPKDSQAHALIASSLNRSNKMKVINCQTAKDIWTRIESIYENKTSFEKQTLLGKLHNYKIRSTHELSTAISDIQNIAAKLELLNEKISDDMIMSIILKALPSNYNQFIISWKLIGEKDRTLNNLISNIMSMAEDESISEDKALIARGKGNRKFQRGSNKRQFNNNSGPNSQQREQPKQISCTYCKKSGHLYEYCYSRKNRESLNRNNSRNNLHPNNNFNRNNRRHTETTSLMAVEHEPSIVDSEWIVDSGSTSHMTRHQEWMTNYSKFDTPRKIRLGDDYNILAVGIGEIITKVGILFSVLHVPDLKENLFSIIAVTKKNIEGKFDNDKIILTKEGLEVTRAYNQNGIYRLMLEILPDTDSAMLAATMEKWHDKFGHVSKDTIKHMADLKIVDGLEITSNNKKTCKDCALGKCRKVSHPSKSTPKADRPGVTLHIDTVGPVKNQSKGGAKYFVLCKDEFSSYRMVAFVDNKSCIADEVKQFISLAELATKNRLLRIVTDNGTEFVNYNLQAFLRARGIEHCKSVAYTPQQNGLIERDIRTVTEMARTILNKSRLPIELWAEAINTSVYILNRILGTNSNRVPYEKWFGMKPRVGNLLTFGQPVVIYKQQQRHKERTKFDNKGTIMTFVGYTENYNTYRVLDPESEQVILACDVIPLEDNIKYKDLRKYRNEPDNFEASIEKLFPTDSDQDSEPPNDSFKTIDSTGEQNKESEDSDHSTADTSNVTSISFPADSPHQAEISDSSKTPANIPSTNQQTSTAADRRDSLEPTNERTHRRTGSMAMSLIPKSLYIHKKPPLVMDEKLRERKVQPDYHAKLSLEEQEETDPNSYTEAMNREDNNEWHKAMEEEIASLMKNKVWILVDRPEGTNIVTSRWVLKKKRKPDGRLDRYKARLVARGFSQIYGVDYNETYAPVANMTSIRLLLAYAAVEKLEIAFFDVKTAFLYGNLDETIYMEQPEGFEVEEDKVCLLKKSLYGLKQAPRQWNIEFKTFLQDMQLDMSYNDQCVFYKLEPLLIIAIYVDDGIIFARNKDDIKQVLTHLRKRFEIHSVEGDTYLGFQIHRGMDKEITIHQTGYIEKILKKFGFDEGKAVSTPTSTNGKPSPLGTDKLDSATPYREAVGSLMYAAVTTRIDIMHSVSMVSRNLQEPTEENWIVVKRIFRYLRGRENLGITYSRKNNKGLLVYCDADFAGGIDTSRSTTGMVMCYGGAPIQWKSQRQTLVTLSSTEAEYVSMCSTIKELIWIRRFAQELKIIDERPTKILCDNESAIKIACNEKSSHRTRHMHVQAAYPREQIELGEVVVQHIKTDYQLADMLTKPTTPQKFERNRNRLMVNLTTLLTALFLGLIGSLAFVDSTLFSKIEPLLYTKTDKFVASGQTVYEIDLHFMSPCYMVEWRGQPPEIALLKPGANESSESHEIKIYNDLKTNCMKLYRAEWELPLGKLMQLSKPPAPLLSLNGLRKKRGLIEFGVGTIFGICISNLVSSMFNFINPSSDHNRILSMDDKFNKMVEIRRTFEEKFNATIEIQAGILRTLKKMSTQIYADHRELMGIEEMLPHFTWLTAFIQARITEVGNDLKEITREFLKGRVAVREVSKLLNLTDIEDINNQDTEFHYLHLGHQHDHVRLRFLVNERSKDTKVYRALGLRHWTNLTGTAEYVTYAGPKYLIYNKTSNCAQGIDEPFSRSVYTTCETKNGRDPNLDLWSPIITEAKVKRNKVNPIEYKTFHYNYIFCYPHDITINGSTFRCPPFTFRLLNVVDYHTMNLHNEPKYKYLNVTYKEDTMIDSLQHNEYQIIEDANTELGYIDQIIALESKLSNLTQKQTEVIYIEKYKETYWSLIALFGVTSLVIMCLICSICKDKDRVVYATVKHDRRTRRNNRDESVELVGSSGTSKRSPPQPPPPLEG